MGKYHCQNCYTWVDELCWYGIYDHTAFSKHTVYFDGEIVNEKPDGYGILEKTFVDMTTSVHIKEGYFKGNKLTTKDGKVESLNGETFIVHERSFDPDGSYECKQKKVDRRNKKYEERNERVRIKGKLDENDINWRDREGIEKDPKVLKNLVIYALEAFGKDSKFPVGMTLQLSERFRRFTEEDLWGSGWTLILDDNDWDAGIPDAGIPYGLIGQSVIKTRNVDAKSL